MNTRRCFVLLSCRRTLLLRMRLVSLGFGPILKSTDLLPLNLRLDSSAHVFSAFKSSCSLQHGCCLPPIQSSRKSTVSSANSAETADVASETPRVWIKKRRGPSTEPWGTPDETNLLVDRHLETWVRMLRSGKELKNRRSYRLCKPMFESDRREYQKK